MNNKTLNTTLIIVAIVFISLVVIICNQQRTIRTLALKSNDNPVIDIDQLQIEKQLEIAPVGYKYPGKDENSA